MFKSLLYFAVFAISFQAIFCQENDLEKETKRDEKLTIDVQIIEEEDSPNGPRKTEVKVNFDIIIEEDVVKVNGKMTELDVLTKYELDAEIIYPNDDSRMLPVTVHLMVAKKITENGHQFLIEEQVQFIEGKRVEQVDVQVLTIHMNVDGKEFRRTVETVAFEESRIKNADLTRYCGRGDDKPQPWKDPVIPDESGFGHGHHKHHHGKSFCSRFHKLPLGARIAILVGIVFVVLAFVMCCAMRCCRKSKKAYEIGKADDFKSEFDMEEEEAEPLPEKLSFDDKDVLIA